MGLSDGFNPCAMWVLVYLISLIAGIQDQRKIWWLVGTFILASGTLYFLFMTAWLNTFLILGYISPLTRFVALLAIGFGASHLYDLAVSRGVIVCEVGDAGSRQRTMKWMRDIVAAPVGLGSLILVIGLAFAVKFDRVRLLGSVARNIYPCPRPERSVDRLALCLHWALRRLFYAG